MYRAAAKLVALLLAAAPLAAGAQSGEITHLSGAVIAQRPDGQSRILSVKSVVNEGDLLVTADNTFARVKFTDGAEVVLRPSSQVKIESYQFDERAPARDGFVMSLLKGGMRSVTGLLARRNPARAVYVTPTATIGIRGTHLGALYCQNDCGGVPTPSGRTPDNGLHVDVADGRIVVTTAAGSREASVGQYVYVASPTAVPQLVPANLGIRASLPAQAVNPAAQAARVGRSQDLECRI